MKNFHPRSWFGSTYPWLKKALLCLGIGFGLILLMLFGVAYHQNSQDISPIPILLHD